MGKEADQNQNGMALSVKPGSSYFWTGDRVFFWLGDTAWLMFHHLTREEIDQYLINRAKKGFNVIQTVAVHHLPAVNVAGRQAFVDNDMTRPDTRGADSYWALVDWTIHRAAQLGLYVAILPHWGNVSDQLTIEDMTAYVHFLSDRYKNEKNIIWMTGGDIRGDGWPEYWRTMGRILSEGGNGRLITYHPFGRTSSLDYFPQEEWIDFHMFQSGHRRYDQQSLDSWDDTSSGRYYGEDNWRYVRDGRLLNRVMPILDGEPSYEHIPQGLHIESEPYWTPQQVRRYGWWSVLSGAAGFTYGHNSIMQFYKGEGPGAFFVRYPWKDALHAPAAAAMCHMAYLMQGIFDELTDRARSIGADPAEYVEQSCGPCERLLTGASAWTDDQRTSRIMAFAADPYILCYTYEGNPIMLRLPSGGTAGDHCEAWWFDPENGVKSYAGTVALSNHPLKFTPPRGDFNHTDWLLILRLITVRP